MTFAIQGGSVDIQVGDYVQVSDACIPPSPDESGLESLNYHRVLQVSGGNLTQVQIKYTNSILGVDNLWIDTAWLMAVLRPIAAT